MIAFEPLDQPDEASAGELAGVDRLTPFDRERLARLLAEGTAPASRRAVASDLRYLAAWSERRHGIGWPLDAVPPAPVPVVVVVRFVVDHLEGLPADIDRHLVDVGVKAAPGPHALATIERRVASLALAHRVLGLPSPTAAEPVRQVLAKARRRAANRDQVPRRKRALTRELLDQLLDTCGPDLAGVRDRAVLLFGFASGGRRRSEVAAARVEDLEPAGDGAYIFRLRRSKSDPEGRGAEFPVVGRAAAAIADWLDAAAIAEGPLFRSIDRWGNLGELGLSGRAVGELVQRRADAAGLDPRAFGGHSLRSGFVTEAGRRGVALGDAMALSNHKSVAVALRYHQAGGVLRNPAARLAE